MNELTSVDKTEGWAQTVVPPPATITLLQKKVLIVLPWLKHCNPITAFCVAQISDKRRTSSVLNYGDAFVAHSRNSCADVFLKSDSEYMLTIDDDMIFPFGHAKWFNVVTGFNIPDKFAALNTIDRLLSHGKALVGGLYFGRQRTGPGMFNESQIPAMNARIRQAPEDVIIPTRWVGTGCMLIHRSVYLDIEKRFPRLARGPDGKGGQWFSSSEHTAMEWIDRTRAMLSTGPMDGEKAVRALTMLETASAEARANSCITNGEDVTFCHRAREAGHQAFVDLGLLCGHIGHAVYGPKNTGEPKPK